MSVSSVHQSCSAASPCKENALRPATLDRDELEVFRSRQRDTLSLCSTAALRFAIAFCWSCDKLSCLKEEVLAACLMCRVKVRPLIALRWPRWSFPTQDLQRAHSAAQCRCWTTSDFLQWEEQVSSIFASLLGSAFAKRVTTIPVTLPVSRDQQRPPI